MSRADWFQLVQIVYWLALATWFGGVLFVAIAAPVIFRTVRDANPVLPHVLSVNLEGQHGTLLAGSVVGNLLVRIGPVQVICAAALLLATGAHFFLANLNGPNRTAAVIRMSLIIAAGGLAAFDAWVVWPQIWRHREQFIEHADEPDVANPALDQFDRGQRRSLVLIMSVLFLLLGLILFSGNITPRAGQPSPAQPNPQAGG